MRLPTCSATERLYDLIDMIDENGREDGAHHKQWVLDQCLRIALGEDYLKWCRNKGWDDRYLGTPP